MCAKREPCGGVPLFFLGVCLALFAGCLEDPIEPQPGEDSERAALVALYEATEGPGWRFRGNWLSDEPVWRWHGVTVDDSLRVVQLRLSDNALRGSIPAELANLTALEVLSVRGNRLSGTIPPQLGDLSALTLLDLGDNRLSGTIPAELGNLTNLVHLDVAQNRLTGAIPASLGRLTALKFLNFIQNDLTGPIPAGLGNLRELTELLLAANELTGPIPAELGNLAGLAEMQLQVNHLTGPIPAELGNMTNLRGLDLGYNDLTGPIPGELGALDSLRLMRLTVNRLTGPIPAELGNLPNLSHMILSGNRLTGPIPAELGNLPNLTTMYLDGNRLIGPIPAGLGNLPLIDIMSLSRNDLTGPIPPELAKLNTLRSLDLSDNALTGMIPQELGGFPVIHDLDLSNNSLNGLIPGELGNLGTLVNLSLPYNDLTGPIPTQLANLASLARLDLSNNELTGQVPEQLGQLHLVRLNLRDNHLAGPIPAELAQLGRLEDLHLAGNRLTGSIPSQLGRMGRLELMDLSRNELTGPIPPALRDLVRLRDLDLSSNDLAGQVPEELGDLATLATLNLRHNSRLSGEIPARWMSLGNLGTLIAGGTRVCAPDDPGLQLWLESIPRRRVSSCQEVAAYLVQAVQSRRFPVPLVAGEDALLRVFPTARRTTDAGIPSVRANFYLDGTKTHTVEIPGKPTPIPTEIDEGSLLKSANAEIPGHLVQPGLEMVIEIDPEGTLDPALGVTPRIPASGRSAIRVETMPPLDFMLLPFLWSEDPDSAILDVAEEMADSPVTHELLAPVRTRLPVADLTAEVHEPVWTSTNEVGELYRETALVRSMERGGALIGLTRYMGMMSGAVEGGTGLSSRGGRHGFVVPDANAFLQQVGHLFNLGSAPCEEEDPDPYYPYTDGSIGAWGYDPGVGKLVSAATPDLMSSCGSVRWISDYHFTNAYTYRLVDERVRGSAAAAPVRSLLVWGGVNADGAPFLEPALVVDAPPTLPPAGGTHQLTGRTAAGDELFSVRFGMAEAAGDDRGSSFVFALPVRAEWEDRLAGITLSGPGGTATLDRESNRPVAIVRDPGTGRIRGILRGASVAGLGGGYGRGDRFQGLEVMTSRGIPGTEA
ncbi:MAG: hypothetical protein F4Z83_08500, partial [Gemmatimonadetes bacterium]|nr:hypothetical protein [Gemmatimonadota bacterium]